jgi:hypothetical protein
VECLSFRNPSSSSLVLSETGSLDRAKAAYERRKKTQIQDSDTGVVSGRVENTRVNANRLIAEILKDTNLEQADDSAESESEPEELTFGNFRCSFRSSVVHCQGWYGGCGNQRGEVPDVDGSAGL